MPRLLRGTHFEEDTWRYLAADEALPATGRVVVPWSRWRALADAAPAAELPGVWLDVDQEPDVLAADLPRIPLLAIRFPSFHDGRGLSLAVLLRTRYGYRGELRAIGQVHEDLTHYMLRCGFDTLLVPDDRDFDTVLRSSALYHDHYQGSVLEPEPAFRRVRRGAG